MAGYSRSDFFGNIVHFDENGKKTGESRTSFFGGYDDYDADGNRIGYSRETGFGGSYIHYDNSDQMTGSSTEGFSGYVHKDKYGNVIGVSDYGALDTKTVDGSGLSGDLYVSTLTQDAKDDGDIKDDPTGNLPVRNSVRYDGCVFQGQTIPEGSGYGTDDKKQGKDDRIPHDPIIIRSELKGCLSGLLLCFGIYLLLLFFSVINPMDADPDTAKGLSIIRAVAFIGGIVASFMLHIPSALLWVLDMYEKNREWKKKQKRIRNGE